MWYSAQTRARKKNIPFTITPEDIEIPAQCPILGIPLRRKKGRGVGDHSPSLDRIFPDRGYIPGNIHVISARANRIKNDSTREEVELLLAWYKALPEQMKS